MIRPLRNSSLKWSDWQWPIANGAGIAADPTLTDAWPCSFNRSSRDADLASDVFPSGCSKTVIRFYHRRSHRHPDLPSTRPGVGRVAIRRSFAYLAQPRFNGRFRSLTFRWWPVPRTVTSPSGPKTFIRRHLRHSAGLVRLTAGNLRTSVIDPPCVRREPSARGSRDVRGQIPLCLPGSEFPFPFRSLDRLGWKLSSPFR